MGLLARSLRTIAQCAQTLITNHEQGAVLHRLERLAALADLISSGREAVDVLQAQIPEKGIKSTHTVTMLARCVEEVARMNADEAVES